MGLWDHGTKQNDYEAGNALRPFPPDLAEKGMVLLASPIVLLFHGLIVQESLKVRH